MDFDFWCHPGNKSISRKVQHVKTPLIFDKIEFCCVPVQFVEWEIFLTPSLESVFQWHSWSAFCRFSQWCQVWQASLMLYTEFKRDFEFESEFIVVYMTKWQPLNSITTAIWHIYYLNTWARAFVIPQKHSWLWNHFTHSSSIKLSIFIVNKPQFLQIAFSKVHCHSQLRWQVQKASIGTIWFSSILQIHLHVKFKRMTYHFLV